MSSRSQASKPTRARPAPASPRFARGRPKAGTGPKISTAILDAATTIFLDRGFAEASMEAISARAGVTKPTLYKRFGDKRQLLQAVLHKNLAKSEWKDAQPSAGNAGDRLKNIATMVLVRGVSPEVRAFHDLAKSAWPSANDMRAREEALGYDRILASIEQEVRISADDLGIRPVRANAVALALMAMLSGWFEHRQPIADQDAADAEEFAHLAVELLIDGKDAW